MTESFMGNFFFLLVIFNLSPSERRPESSSTVLLSLQTGNQTAGKPFINSIEEERKIKTFLIFWFKSHDLSR